MAGRRRWPIVAMAAMACVAAGCTNRVVADTPRYSSEEASSRFALKDGLWLVDDQKCVFDSGLPAATWPDCAQWGIVQGGRPTLSDIVGGEQGVTHDANGSVPIVTIDGDPMIQELSDCPWVVSEPVAGNQLAPMSAADKMDFCYNGLLVIDRDQDERVTTFVSWPVFCGPPPPKDQSVTDRPWEGLKIRGENCLAENEAALRNAARRSFDLVDGTVLASRSRWVRASLD